MGLKLFRSTKARVVVRLRQMLHRCRIGSRFSLPSAGAPPDVPAGHVAVRVGRRRRRYVVPAGHLNHPAFRSLLSRAEEEYGFEGVVGPISLPCDESAFEDAVRSIVSCPSTSQPKWKSKFKSGRTTTSTSCCCSWWRRHVFRWRLVDGDSRPLLH